MAGDALTPKFTNELGRRYRDSLCWISLTACPDLFVARVSLEPKPYFCWLAAKPGMALSWAKENIGALGWGRDGLDTRLLWWEVRQGGIWLGWCGDLSGSSLDECCLFKIPLGCCVGSDKRKWSKLTTNIFRWSDEVAQCLSMVAGHLLARPPGPLSV